MTTAYLVTDGSYSSYHVVAAFSREEEAERVAVSLGDEAQVESFEMIEDAGQPVAVLSMHFKLNAPGWRPELETSDFSMTDIVWPWFETSTAFEARRKSIDEIRGQVEHGNLFGLYDLVRVRGADHDRVRKVYGELRAAVLHDATELGILWDHPVEPPPWVIEQRGAMILATSDLVVHAEGEEVQ